MKGLIYKITCNITNNIYIGSTTQKLNVRISKHMYKYKLYKNGLSHFVSSYLIFDNNDYKYECIEEIEVDTKEEILLREKWYIQNNKCVNYNNPIESKQEYKKRHKIANKKYYETHKQEIKDKQREYNEEHKDNKREYDKQYRLKNLDKIKKYNNEKLNCPCGGCFTKINKSRHNKSNMHIEYLENLK
jgi:hypothetical protein